MRCAWLELRMLKAEVASALNHLLGPRPCGASDCGNSNARQRPDRSQNQWSAALGQLVPQPKNENAQKETQHGGKKQWTPTRLDVAARQNALCLEMLPAQSRRFLIVVCGNKFFV